MAIHIAIPRHNGMITLVRKELETATESPLTEHEQIINELYEQLKSKSNTFKFDLNSKAAQEYRCEQMEKILKAPSKVYLFIDGKYVELKP